MKISTKLLIALSTLPILLILLIGTGMVQISHLNKSADSLKTNYELSLLAEQIHTDFKNEGIRLRNIVIFNDENAIQKEMALLEADSDSVRNHLYLLESKATANEQKVLIETLKSINSEFNVYKNEVISLVSEDRDNEALSLIDETSAEIHEDFFNSISDISETFGSNLQASLDTMISDSQRETILGVVVVAVGVLIVIFVFYKNIKSLTSRLNSISRIMSNVANGKDDLSTKVEIINDDEIDHVAKSFNQMTDTLEEKIDMEQQLTWVKANIADISTSLSGTHDLETLGSIFLSKVVPLVESSHAVFYVKDTNSESNNPEFMLTSSYAFKERKHIANKIQAGEGLLGQAILEKSPIILTDVPSDYVRISSGLGEATPLTLYVLPICFEGEVKAVLEMASFKPYSETYQEFLEELIDDLGIILESVMGRIQLAKLLEESQTLNEEVQAQSEELQNQQEELKAANEELEEQTIELKQSEEKLQMQQEELEETNRNLEEKTKTLEDQNKEFERANKELENARAELEEKAEELALSSKYKSEFLANMSHELRTPLNSLLILSKLLADNANKNLTPKQVEYSKTIYSSGKDLLSLINDILDLAKIESGKTEVNLSNVSLNHFVEFVENSFKPLANQKKLDFHVLLTEDLPNVIYTDESRLQQILNNLLSNAFKFTKEGSVTLEISEQSSASKQRRLAFSVKDTGIGIAKDKQKLIFEAFQQADGTTSRKYGGTGLGLSISRELAALLHGEIVVESEEGKGSTFTLYIRDYENNENEVDNRLSIDEVAATVERKIAKNERIKKENPIEMESESDDSPIKRVLIVDDDLNQRNSLMELIGDMDIVLKAVSSGHEAMEELKVDLFDCIILDLGLSDTNGFDLLEKIKENDENSKIKVIVYTGRDLTSKEEIQLNRYAYTIIIKNEHSPERLKAELELYLQESNNEVDVKDKSTDGELKFSSDLDGKKVLLVDDDVRNVFALTSILEQSGLDITFAENGYEGIEALRSNPDIDLVLMDIMMPEMDGYEAIRRIREMAPFERLPIIAVTAKAMKEDRERCMEVGASDYVVKPIEPDQLISLIKVWLYQ